MSTGSISGGDGISMEPVDSSSITLTDGHILVGSAANVATDVAVSGDATLANTGALTLATVTVPKGGTGLTSATAYAVICGGTTSTAAFQSIAGVGTSGQVLTSNGAAALPTFQTAASGATLNGITAATGAATIASGNNHSIIWNWALTTDSVNAINFGETTAATNGTVSNGIPNQAVAKFATLAASTASPLVVYARGNVSMAASSTTNQMVFRGGTLANPGITFRTTSNPLSYGFYLGNEAGSPTQINVSVAGTQSFQFGSTNNQSGLTLYTVPGSSTTVGFSDTTSANTGLAWPVTNAMSVINTTATNKEWVRWKSGHSIAMGGNPTITAGGGTSPAIAGKDEAFIVTIGTGGVDAGFTVTFITAFTTNAPIATANSDTDIVALKVVTTTTTVAVTAAAPLTAGSKVHVHVRGWE